MNSQQVFSSLSVLSRYSLSGVPQKAPKIEGSLAASGMIVRSRFAR